MEKFVKETGSVKGDLELTLADHGTASALLKLFVEALPVSGINGLFKIITGQLKKVIAFDEADLLIFDDNESAAHSRLSYSKGLFYEPLNVNDPLLIAATDKKSLSRFFTPDRPRQIAGSYWLGKLPPQSLFFKKETTFNYSYFIPVTGVYGLGGLLQFRTNSRDGFSPVDQSVFHLVEQLLQSKLKELLDKPTAEESRYDGAGEDGRTNLAVLALNFELATIRTETDLCRISYHNLQALLPGTHVQLFRTVDNGENYKPITDPAFPYKGPGILKAAELLSDHGRISSANPYRPAEIIDLAMVKNAGQSALWVKEKLRQGFTKVMFLGLGDQDKSSGLMAVFFNGEADMANLNKVKAISWQLSIALNNIAAYEKITDQLKEIDISKLQLEIESDYLHEEIETTFNYGDIIGISGAMKKVFFLVSQVAETQSSVLILGETGTGKELIARALHNASPRRKKLMVKVNCAALPANLIESELFGHEKGSFTGASERRIGKFELANNSTLFLDEVGELPLDLQVKLLRALQEQEIERIGGTSVIKVNVRIITATNRNLYQEVQAGNFRSDLYFRLNVFPIILPPLRDRKEDIPLLATHFLEKQIKKSSTKITGFSSKVMKRLKAYDWPGNIRELEHMIERCVLLTKGPVVTHVPVLLSGKEQSIQTPDVRIKTIDEIEREHILFVLKKCNNKVSGIGGAAEVLEIPASTLNSKMRRLKIKRTYNKT